MTQRAGRKAGGWCWLFFVEARMDGSSSVAITHCAKPPPAKVHSLRRSENFSSWTHNAEKAALAINPQEMLLWLDK